MMIKTILNRSGCHAYWVVLCVTFLCLYSQVSHAEISTGQLFERSLTVQGEVPSNAVERFIQAAAQHGIEDPTKITDAMFQGDFNPPMAEVRLVFNALVPSGQLNVSPSLRRELERISKLYRSGEARKKLRERVKAGEFEKVDGQVLSDQELLMGDMFFNANIKTGVISDNQLNGWIYVFARRKVWDERFGTVAGRTSMNRSNDQVLDRSKWTTIVHWAPDYAITRRDIYLKKIQNAGQSIASSTPKVKAWVREMEKIPVKFDRFGSDVDRIAVHSTNHTLPRKPNSFPALGNGGGQKEVDPAKPVIGRYALQAARQVHRMGYTVDPDAPMRLEVDVEYVAGEFTQTFRVDEGFYTGKPQKRVWKPSATIVTFNLTAPGLVLANGRFQKTRVSLRSGSYWINGNFDGFPERIEYLTYKFMPTRPGHPNAAKRWESFDNPRVKGGLLNPVEMKLAVQNDWDRQLDWMALSPKAYASFHAPLDNQDALNLRKQLGSKMWVRTTSDRSDAGSVVREKMLSALVPQIKKLVPSASSGFYLDSQVWLERIDSDSSLKNASLDEKLKWRGYRAYAMMTRQSLGIVNGLYQVKGKWYRTHGPIATIAQGDEMMLMADQTKSLDILLSAQSNVLLDQTYWQERGELYAPTDVAWRGQHIDLKVISDQRQEKIQLAQEHARKLEEEAKKRARESTPEYKREVAREAWLKHFETRSKAMFESGELSREEHHRYMSDAIGYSQKISLDPEFKFDLTDTKTLEAAHLRFLTNQAAKDRAREVKARQDEKQRMALASAWYRAIVDKADEENRKADDGNRLYAAVIRLSHEAIQDKDRVFDLSAEAVEADYEKMRESALTEIEVELKRERMAKEWYDAMMKQAQASKVMEQEGIPVWVHFRLLLNIEQRSRTQAFDQSSEAIEAEMKRLLDEARRQAGGP